MPREPALPRSNSNTPQGENTKREKHAEVKVALIAAIASITAAVVAAVGSVIASQGAGVATQKVIDITKTPRYWAPPVGTIAAYSGGVAESDRHSLLERGWLLCDGAELSRNDFSELFAVIGETWGSGNRTTTFHIPDLRGQFLRGVDAGAGQDVDAMSRGAIFDGGNTGDRVGTYQSDETKSHFHPIQDRKHTHRYVNPRLGGGITQGGGSTGKAGGSDDTEEGNTGITKTELSGGSESRPKNAAVHWIIRIRV